MNIKNTSLYVFLVFVIVLDSLHYPEFAFFLVVFHIQYLLKYKVSQRILIRCLKFFTIYIFLIFISFTYGIFYLDYFSVIRDIWYFVKPVVYLIYGALLLYRISEKTLLKIILNSTVLGGFLYIFPIIYDNDFLFLSVDDLRDTYGQGSIAFAISFMILYVSKMNKYISNKRFLILFIIFLTILFFTSSRLWVVIAILAPFHIIKSGKFLNKFTYSLFFLVIIYFSIPVQNNIAQDAVRSTFFEKMIFLTQEIKPQNFLFDSDIHNYWRGYEAYQAVNKFKDTPMFNKFIGSGMGEFIEIDFRKRGRFDDSELYSLTWLHNGYYTIVIKMGIFGLICLVFTHIKIYQLAKLFLDKNSTVLIKYILTTTILTTFSNGGILNKYDTLLIYLLFGFYFALSIKRKNENFNDSSKR